MTWPVKDIVARGIINMLQGNLGLRPGERLLVMTDVPRSEDWVQSSLEGLEEILERAVLGHLFVDVARSAFPASQIILLPYATTGAHGREPDEATASRMLEAEVIVALTTYSLSHTNARTAATSRGARVASMPTFTAEMLAPGGPLAADAGQIAADCRLLADRLTAAEDAIVHTPYGTDLRFILEGRQAIMDDGIYSEPGRWGNLPAGEAYLAPVEGTGEGQLVVPAGWHAGLTDDMAFRVVRGSVVDLQGGGEVGDHFRRLLNLDSSNPVVLGRRNLAELGIGCNPNAFRTDSILEAEKIKGTVHIAIGDNLHMGGRVEADLHQDFVQPQPDLILDGRPVIVNGVWII